MIRLASGGKDLENNSAYRMQRQSMFSRGYMPVGVFLGQVDDQTFARYVDNLRVVSEKCDALAVQGEPAIELITVEPVEFGEPGIRGHSTARVIYARSWVVDGVRREMTLQAAGLSGQTEDPEAQRELEGIMSKPADHYFDPDAD